MHMVGRSGLPGPPAAAPVALVIYPTTPDGQSRQADDLARIASAKIRELPGFLRGRVFGSEAGRAS